MKKLYIMILVIFLSGCSTPLGTLSTILSIGEATEAVSKAESKDTVGPPAPKTVESIPLPEQTPKLDIEKGLNAIPLWLILVSIASGILLFINMLRHRKLNNKGASHDTSRSIDDGRWSSDGRSVQVHGSSAEEQASADGNDDEGSPAAARAQVGRPRVSIQVGRRSSSESR